MPEHTILKRLINIRDEMLQEELTNNTHADGGAINAILCVTRQWDRSTRSYNHKGYPSVKHGSGGKVRKKYEERRCESKHGCKIQWDHICDGVDHSKLFFGGNIRK